MPSFSDNREHEHKTVETLLGFDFGLKRIGVAVGQTITKTATPLKTLAAQSGVPEWEQVADIISQWHPDALVVGIPYNMDGSEYDLTQLARDFANELQKRYNLTVHHVDERLSTIEARQQIFDAGGYRKLQQAQVDNYAAKLILETWLARF